MKIKPGIAISTDWLSVEDQRVFVDLCVMNGGKKRINESSLSKNFIAWGVTTNNIYFCDSIDTNHTLVSIDQITEALEKPHFDFSRRPSNPAISLKNAVNEFNEAIESFTAAFKDNDWHERGEKPPVHENIEWCGKRGGYWVKARVVDYTDDQICLLHHSDQSYKPHKMEVFNFSDIDLRPLKTERERAIEEMVAVIKSVPEYNDFGVAETLYDAGFRREEK